MSNNDKQALFMEALNSIKEYAKVNAGVVTNEDINSFFKDMDLDASKMSMISGYLMANGIKVSGLDSSENEFLQMFENTAANTSENTLDDSVNVDAAENMNSYEGSVLDKDAMHNKAISDQDKVDSFLREIDDGNEPISLENSDVESNEDKQAGFVAQMIADNTDYDKDDQYLTIYLKDLENIDSMSDTTRSYLLMNIVEDKDKESLQLLLQSYLEKIVEWIEPYRRRGVLANDLIQEGNLAMTAYIGQQQFLSNAEWVLKIRDGNSDDLMAVLNQIDEAVKQEVIESVERIIEEQNANNTVAGRVLNKVNLVNDWAQRLEEELGRKPTVKEVAEKMGVSEDIVDEAVKLSAKKMETINIEQ